MDHVMDSNQLEAGCSKNSSRNSSKRILSEKSYGFRITLEFFKNYDAVCIFNEKLLRNTSRNPIRKAHGFNLSFNYLFVRSLKLNLSLQRPSLSLIMCVFVLSFFHKLKMQISRI